LRSCRHTQSRSITSLCVFGTDNIQCMHACPGILLWLLLATEQHTECCIQAPSWGPASFLVLTCSLSPLPFDMAAYAAAARHTQLKQPNSNLQSESLCVGGQRQRAQEY
jgi:hypothetical protein